MILQFNSWVYIARENKDTDSEKDTAPIMFRTALLYNCQGMKATSVSISRWMKKDLTALTHIMEYCSIVNKNEILPFVNNLDGLEGHYA